MSSLTRRSQRSHKEEEGASASKPELKRKRCSFVSAAIFVLTNTAKIAWRGFLVASFFWIFVVVKNREKIFGSTGDGHPIRRVIGNDVVVQLHFNGTGTESKETNVITASFGVHKATVSVKVKCKMPLIWLRLVGDALIPIPLKPANRGSLTGTFEVPMEGRYTLDARWYGCGNITGHTSFAGLSSPLHLIVEGSYEHLPSASKVYSQVWMATDKFKFDGETPPTPHVWMTSDQVVSPETVTLLPASSSIGSSLVAKEATPVSDGFRHLSNYEIVCWVGGKSAAVIREAFLSLRPRIAKTQRPFKFHYRNVTNFKYPDQHWTEDDATRFRKCKIVFVSADILDEPVSQVEYMLQVKTFLGHLVKALNDDTFPIWMATVNFPPMAASSMCHSPTEWNTSHHPCNEALFQLFRTSSLPGRVHLMDNTDLSLPMYDGHTEDIVSVIAMRVFAIIGLQVDVWRKHGQKGVKDGLVRGTSLEPNRKLVPYDWS